jgi:hypothetical protein
MKRWIFQTTIGEDGILSVPLGVEESHREVLVTVEPIDDRTKSMTQDEWRAFVLATAGSIDDPTFERPPQGSVETRDELP